MLTRGKGAQELTSSLGCRRRDLQAGASGEGCDLLVVDLVDQRVGVAMHQQPVGALPAIDMGDPHRQVLVGRTADLAVLPLDRHQDGGVTPGVGLDLLQPRLAIGEGALPAPKVSARSSNRRAGPPLGSIKVKPRAWWVSAR